MAERRRRARAAAWTIAAATLAAIAVAAVITWRVLPRVCPRLVLRWTPWTTPGLRALAYAGIDDREAAHAFFDRTVADEAAMLRAELALLRDSEPRVRAQACALLVDPWTSDVASLPTDVRTRLADELWRLAVDVETPPVDAGLAIVPSPEDPRESALGALALLRDPRIAPIYLRRIAEDDRTGAVGGAASALANIDAAAYAPAIIEAWRRRPDDARTAALAVLPSSALDGPLAEAMRDAPVARRLAVVRRLREHERESEDDHEALLAVLARPSSGQPQTVRAAALDGLYRGVPVAAAALREIALADDDLAPNAYCRLRPEVFGTPPAALDAALVAAALEAPRADVRRRALIDVDHLAPRERAALADRVGARLRDEREVVTQAIVALTGLDAAAAAQPITTALADHDIGVRVAALLVVGGRDDDLGLAALDRAWASSIAIERAAALVAQARRKLPEVEARALGALADADAHLRGAACSALRRITAVGSTGALLALLEHERDPRVSAAALEALTSFDLDEARAERVDAIRDELDARYGEALHSPWDDW